MASATPPLRALVLVGRNAKENDLLTRLAHSEDLWFHAQGVPGSHVILKAEGKNPPLEDLLFAAKLAAYHSKARGGPGARGLHQEEARLAAQEGGPGPGPLHRGQDPLRGGHASQGGGEE